MARTYDLSDDSVVVVIGSGAGGATVSRGLAQSGVDVVCLEAGGPVGTIVNDTQAMFPRLTWLDPRIGTGELPAGFPVWSGKNVGGTTLHWTASAPRIPDAELTPTRYFGGLRDCTVIDWPIPAEEMGYWYAQAEKDMGVSGTNGWPKLPKSNNYLVLEAAARKIGLNKITRGNMAINSVPQGGRTACLQLGFCVSGCAINAKWTAANTPLLQAADTDHFELRPNSFVLRVEPDGNGRVSEVVYVDAEGNTQSQKARAVCMAANAIDTPRILLNSNSAKFPAGLANGSGHVGRHFVKHVFAIVTAIMPGPVHFNRGTDNLGHVDDFVESDASRGFAGGFKFEQVNFDPVSLASLARPGAWGAEYAGELSQYDHFTGLLVVGEDPSQVSNGVSLHPTEKDEYGMPVPVVHYESHENSKQMRDFAVAKAREMYGALGSEDIFLGPLPPSTHNMGTCRMAESGALGVCDPYGRGHEVPNLFFSDGSVFPSSGSSNPTITIVALASRQAEHMVSLMSQKAL
jgi:choline dehydrogenase-like flavoprotein